MAPTEIIRTALGESCHFVFGDTSGNGSMEVNLSVILDSPLAEETNPTMLAVEFRRLADKLDASYHYQMGLEHGRGYRPQEANAAAAE